MKLGDLITNFISSFRTSLALVLTSLIVVYFIWNTIKFINTTEDKERADRRQSMIYGIVSLAVAVSFWGLISVFQTTFGLENSSKDIHTQVKSLFKSY